VYKGLDIATAKPTAQERDEVQHWGLDLIEPGRRFSAADFKMYADAKIDNIASQGKMPIIVGGTGLYVDAVLFDFAFGSVADDLLRQELEPMSIEEVQQIIIDRGIEMPENLKNKRYLIRAIEQGGINKQKSAPLADALIIGLNPGMQVLEERIKNRANDMLKNGAINEAKWLFDNYGYDAPAVYAPFFKAFAPHFLDGISTAECLERDIINNRQLAKRQVAWFKRNPHIHWFTDANDAHNFVLSKMYT
jgi:tRNA dimethylallyltransferase